MSTQNSEQAPRVEFRLRNYGVLEATPPLRDGQALAPYLASRRGSISLRNVVWRETGKRAEELTLAEQEIVWARSLHSSIPLTNVAVSRHADLQEVSVVLAGGQILVGRLPVVRGQSLSDFLGSVGHFPALRDACLPDGTRLGDVALNVDALRSIRPVAARTTGLTWDSGDRQPAGPQAGALRQHWLLELARRCDLHGAADLKFAVDTTTPEVWRALCAAAGCEENDLAKVVARELRLECVVAREELSPDTVIPAEVAARYGVRGVSDDGRTLTVATADPLSADAEQALAFACKRRIRFAVAGPSLLQLATPPADAESELESLLAGMGALTGDVVQVHEDAAPQGAGADDVTSEPIIKLANLVLREAVRQGASDIHIEPDSGRGVIRLRVDGVLRQFMQIPLVAFTRVVSRFKILADLDISDRVRPQDGRARVRIDSRVYDIRMSTVPTQDVEKVVMRIGGAVHEQTLDQLEISDVELRRLRKLLAFRDGIIVVTGPTGSGKTTTLYAALQELNNGQVNIMTVEDPVERVISGATQIQVQPKRGVTFASSLRAILRQDPDVILVGEIRDAETAAIAVQAAMTGHLVLATLHTTTAVGVVERLRDLGLDRTSLASSLRGVVGQRLARRVCSSCSGAGCTSCHGSGLSGRLPVLEVLAADAAFAELIGREAGYHDLLRAAAAGGMRTMREVAEERMREGLTTAEEIARVIGESDQAPGLAGTDTRDARALPGGASVSTAVVPAVADTTELPAPRPSGFEIPDMPGAQRAATIRLLAHALDRSVVEGHGLEQLLQHACSQLSSAFDAPLVWSAVVEGRALRVLASAGPCAPFSADLIPSWDQMPDAESAVGIALHTGTPQGRHSGQETECTPWRENARLHGVPIFLAIPLMSRDGGIGVIGIHANSMDGLDQHAGGDLLTAAERISAAIQRTRQMHTAGLHVAALEHAVDAVLAADREGVIQWVNRAFTELSGYASGEVVGRHVSMLRSERQTAEFYDDLWTTILRGRAWRGELYNVRRDGSEYAVEQTITPVVDNLGSFSYFLAVQRDITERKRHEESVLQLVTIDSLTRLPNNRAFDAESARITKAVAEGAPAAALLLIKQEAAAAGHDASAKADADEMLRRLAATLNTTLRPGDFLARLGEDEFVALLPAADMSGAACCAARLQDAIAGERAASPAIRLPAVRIGIAPIDGTQGARAILAMAEAALYGSRERQENIVLHTGAADTDHHSGDEEWARRIRDALEFDQFVLHFQPVVRLDTGAVSHWDALIRLHDDDGEVIPARAFIAHAENLGLMPQIDQWVLENVLRMLRTAPELRISMNLSMKTVSSTVFREFLRKQGKRMSAYGARIIFEVTEVSAGRELTRAIEHMMRLRELGCCFALDNFGIGCASIASLGALPVDYVKLDGTLIAGIPQDRTRREMVMALATVARALGKEVIAAGAESGDIVDTLAMLGIDLGQGHFIGVPTADMRSEPTYSAAVLPLRREPGHAQGTAHRFVRPRVLDRDGAAVAM